MWLKDEEVSPHVLSLLEFMLSNRLVFLDNARRILESLEGREVVGGEIFSTVK